MSTYRELFQHFLDLHRPLMFKAFLETNAFQCRCGARFDPDLDGVNEDDEAWCQECRASRVSAG